MGDGFIEVALALAFVVLEALGRRVRKLGRLIQSLLAHWILVHTRINEHAWCPRCGHRQGKIEYRSKDNQEQIVHTCFVCTAEWAQEPLVKGTR